MINRTLTQVEIVHDMVPLWDEFDLLMHDNETGETKTVHIDLTWYGHSLFMWQEGNFSCDCNRGDFFYPESRHEDHDYPCNGRRFTIIKAIFDDGSEERVD